MIFASVTTPAEYMYRAQERSDWLGGPEVADRIECGLLLL